jgi:hypothetical protein
MSEYAERLAEDGIEISVLIDLTDQDLKDIGVLLGHRRKCFAPLPQEACLSRWPMGVSSKTRTLDTSCPWALIAAVRRLMRFCGKGKERRDFVRAVLPAMGLER